MIPSNLTSLLASRKKIVDESDTSDYVAGVGSGRSVRNAFDDKYIEKSSTGFTGLINQGATCYLNSLLQTLFMIPEFRTELFLTSFAEHESSLESNLAYQLQKLFAQLQISLRGAISTSALTKSFGWTGRDAFIQQDIQECMTVIFDFLSYQYLESSISNFLLHKWSGEISIHLMCHKCHHTRTGQESFRDIQLQVNNEITNLQSSFECYQSKEIIDDVNCDICQSRNTHSKYNTFSKLPLILSCQLRRFDMNWETMQRTKLQNPVDIPFTLILHEIEHAQNAVTERTPAAGISDATQGSDVITASNSNVMEVVYDLQSILMHTGSAHSGHYFSYVKDVTLPDKNNNNGNSESGYGNRSEIGVVMSSKSEKNKWYHFNDSSVTELDDSQMSLVGLLSKSPTSHDSSTMSGTLSGSSSSQDDKVDRSNNNSNGSSVRENKNNVKLASVVTNAYMLVYRMIERRRICPLLTKESHSSSSTNQTAIAVTTTTSADDEKTLTTIYTKSSMGALIPYTLQQEIERDNKNYLESYQRYQYERSFLHLSVTYRNENKSTTNIFRIHDSKTMQDFTSMVYEHFTTNEYKPVKADNSNSKQGDGAKSLDSVALTLAVKNRGASNNISIISSQGNDNSITGNDTDKGNVDDDKSGSDVDNKKEMILDAEQILLHNVRLRCLDSIRGVLLPPSIVPGRFYNTSKYEPCPLSSIAEDILKRPFQLEVYNHNGIYNEERIMQLQQDDEKETALNLTLQIVFYLPSASATTCSSAPSVGTVGIDLSLKQSSTFSSPIFMNCNLNITKQAFFQQLYQQFVVTSLDSSIPTIPIDNMTFVCIIHDVATGSSKEVISNVKDINSNLLSVLSHFPSHQRLYVDMFRTDELAGNEQETQSQQQQQQQQQQQDKKGVDREGNSFKLLKSITEQVKAIKLSPSSSDSVSVGNDSKRKDALFHYFDSLSHQVSICVNDLRRKGIRDIVTASNSTTMDDPANDNKSNGNIFTDTLHDGQMMDVTIDGRWTFLQLKKYLSTLYQLSIHEFILYNSAWDIEYKDMEVSLISKQIFDGCVVHTKCGKPLSQHEYKIQLLYNNIYHIPLLAGNYHDNGDITEVNANTSTNTSAEESKQELANRTSNNSNVLEDHSYQRLGDVIISDYHLIKDIKKMILDTYTTSTSDVSQMKVNISKYRTSNVRLQLVSKLDSREVVPHIPPIPGTNKSDDDTTEDKMINSNTTSNSNIASSRGTTPVYYTQYKPSFILYDNKTVLENIQYFNSMNSHHIPSPVTLFDNMMWVITIGVNETEYVDNNILLHIWYWKYAVDMSSIQSVQLVKLDECVLPPDTSYTALNDLVKQLHHFHESKMTSSESTLEWNTKQTLNSSLGDISESDLVVSGSCSDTDLTATTAVQMQLTETNTVYYAKPFSWQLKSMDHMLSLKWHLQPLQYAVVSTSSSFPPISSVNDSAPALVTCESEAVSESGSRSGSEVKSVQSEIDIITLERKGKNIAVETISTAPYRYQCNHVVNSLNNIVFIYESESKYKQLLKLSDSNAKPFQKNDKVSGSQAQETGFRLYTASEQKERKQRENEESNEIKRNLELKLKTLIQ